MCCLILFKIVYLHTINLRNKLEFVLMQDYPPHHPLPILSPLFSLLALLPPHLIHALLPPGSRQSVYSGVFDCMSDADDEDKDDNNIEDGEGEHNKDNRSKDNHERYDFQ